MQAEVQLLLLQGQPVALPERKKFVMCSLLKQSSVTLLLQTVKVDGSRTVGAPQPGCSAARSTYWHGGRTAMWTELKHVEDGRRIVMVRRSHLFSQAALSGNVLRPPTHRYYPEDLPFIIHYLFATHWDQYRVNSI